MNISELFGKQEALDPELAACIDDSGPLGRNLKHPLVFSIFYHEAENAILNAALKQKKEYIENCRQQGNWSGIVWMYERPYRFLAFKQIERNLSDQAYWDLLGSIWTDAENIWQYKRDLNNFFHPKKRDWSQRIHMMDEAERDTLAALPNILTIYRGCSALNRRGYSWTLEHSKALWFAKRFAIPNSPKPLVLTAEISKAHVLAYFAGRNEKEIVVLPEHLKIIKTERL